MEVITSSLANLTFLLTAHTQNKGMCCTKFCKYGIIPQVHHPSITWNEKFIFHHHKKPNQMSEINFDEPISFPTLIFATTSRHLSLATSGPMETLSPLSLGPLCSGSPCTSTTNPSTKVTNLDLMFHCILCTPIFCQKLSHINEYFLCTLCNLWNFKFFCAKFFSFASHQSPPPPSPAPRLSLAHLLHPSPSTDCPGL